MYFPSLVLLILLLYLLGILVIYLTHRNIIYHPYTLKNLVTKTSEQEMMYTFKKIKIRVSKNISLNSWFYFRSNLKKTLLFLPGNAGDLNRRINKLNYLGRLDLNILIISWRGYHFNNGNPSEIGLYDDASSSLNYLLKKGISEKDIILYGESLGAAVAIEIAQFKSLGGVILESAFTSLEDLANRVFPFFPYKLILKDSFTKSSE